MIHDDALRGRLQPVSRHSGFRMDGYFVWCASAIRVGPTYHLFAARWPVATGFPDGYRQHNVGRVTGHVRWGARLVSPDGVRDWRVFEPEPSAYDHTIPWAEGGAFAATRRERPWLLVENGRATGLFTGVYDGTSAWNQPVPIEPPWPVAE
jgi:hypothetical protein